ncbi:glycerophosphodiester phosphodiesterase family protein [Pseudaestuariivita rosea]|uniref:glycerophosphodiester phosphodiesterase family protein n=1 Tax=Pseudaestuariivita rosea TaxID=2763263 RepID=UPI001ABA2647|nr:glycerophosphodiester phosphodiesterase family protein [Pseudaestuariivita rosea]
MTLPPSFLTQPLAHRALHDICLRRPENSRAAVQAAVDAGYGIEIDVQLTCDGHAVVFHDHTLDRLAGRHGEVRDEALADLQAMPLVGGDETIPSLTEILQIVAGRVPLLIEIKDQDGRMGPRVGALERAVATVLQGYQGDVAVMAFNPHSIAQMADLAPEIPRGLVTCAYTANHWPGLPQDRRDSLAKIDQFDAVGASFISHAWGELDDKPVKALKKRGVPVLCWTIRSPKEEAIARKIADNVTFEGYLA